jgi:predicted secreted protein
VRLTSAIAIYFIIWWIVLFAVLPFGVNTHDEAGASRVPGQADSAPHNPMLLRKVFWTSVVSAVIFGIYYLNYTYGWIGLADLPGG